MSRSAPEITGKAQLAGVVGWPVSHSRSPSLHNYWLAGHEIDGVYVPLAVRPGSFRVAMDGLRMSGFRGVNVTIPYKEEAFRYADRLDPMAERCGSVNTLVFHPDGTSEGFSTDGAGLLASLAQEADYVPQGRALVLGAGGAARSVAAALLERGVDVAVSNRTFSKAEELAKILGDGMSTLPWKAWEERLGAFSLLVNTTSLGMHGGPDEEWCPDLGHASKKLIVSDIVYVPQETPLLREAQRRRLRAVGGLGMLLHQARAGFAMWFGVEPEVDEATFAHVMRGLS